MGGNEISKLKKTYKLGSLLGEGGFGKVVKARNRQTGREVALKQIPIAKMSAALQKYANSEVEILRSLHHVNIVEFYHVYSTPHYLYISMELLSGGTLANYIEELSDSERRMPINEVQRIVRVVSGVLEYVHRNKIIHRDIKPANIGFRNMSRRDVVVMDFGVAKTVARDDGATQTFIGTPTYIAPEIISVQFAASRHDHSRVYSYAADMWSLGVVVFEVLTGRLPFYSFDQTELYAKISAGLRRKHANCLRKAAGTSALDFVTRLLETDMKRRANAADALKHPWLSRDLERKNEEIEAKKIEAVSMEHIKTLRSRTRAKQKLRRATANIIWKSMYLRVFAHLPKRLQDKCPTVRDKINSAKPGTVLHKIIASKLYIPPSTAAAASTETEAAGPDKSEVQAETKKTSAISSEVSETKGVQSQ